MFGPEKEGPGQFWRKKDAGKIRACSAEQVVARKVAQTKIKTNGQEKGMRFPLSTGIEK